MIIIDPGHGGADPGAVHNGLIEKELVLDISNILVSLIGNKYDTLLTRNSNSVKPSFASRVSATKDAKAFISIHVNASTSSSARGYETLMYSKASQVTGRLAKLVHNRVIGSLQHYHKIKAPTYKVLDRGIKPRELYVLRNSKCPAILVECGFITNKLENALLRDRNYLWTYANAIHSGLVDFLKS